MYVLFSLELFDAGSTVGLNIANFVQVLNMKTQVKTGWRIYDPSTRTILDQFFINRDLNCQGGNFLTVSSAQLGRKRSGDKSQQPDGRGLCNTRLPLLHTGVPVFIMCGATGEERRHTYGASG